MNHKFIQLEIAGYANKRISIDINFTKGLNDNHLVVFCHGFKGFKDWGSFNYIAKCFSDAGIAFLKFNFSHNGTSSEQPNDFVDLEAFGKNNFSIELYDLDCVLNWVKSSFTEKTGICYKTIILMGHSRGGGISILKAAKDNRINKLITWASVSDFQKRLNAYPLDLWKKERVIYILNSRTNQQMPLYFQFYQDYLGHKDDFNILHKAKSIKVPWLIVHAENDDVVLIEEAKNLCELNDQAVLETIQGGSHTFGAKQPFDDKAISEYLKLAISKSVNFCLN